jgi:ammonium transporter, Amt family
MLATLRQRGFLAASFLLLLPMAAWAQDPTAAPAAPVADKGDTAFILVCAALVLFMTPGLALFYAGMARRKNVLATMMQSMIAMGLVTVLWIIVGYSLAFATGNPFIGDPMKYLGLNGVSAKDPHTFYGTTIPHQLFMVFQLMFAIITPALISGAFAERMRFSSYLLFIGLWSLLVYSPIAHWVWGEDGWLLKLGALDFAGGTVVHISSGVTALVACIMIGKRKGYPSDEMRPHNLTMTLLGTGILWFGWYGFNGGSALAANDLAVSAFVNTHIAAAVATLAWMFAEWAQRGKPTALGAASGAVAGLVGITPAAGFVGPMGALAIGALTGLACYFAVVTLKSKLGYDDSLDTFGVHGVGGTVGAILTGVFALQAVNPIRKDAAGQPLPVGLIEGHANQVLYQLAGVAATWVFAAVVGAIILFVVDKITGLRVKSTDEEVGLDVSQHGEEGYVL